MRGDSEQSTSLWMAPAAPPALTADARADVCVVGAGIARQRYGRLEAWARRRFPGMREVLFRWSDQVMEPMDGLAFIGRNPLDQPNVFIATGDSGMGMTHGTAAGLIPRAVAR